MTTITLRTVGTVLTAGAFATIAFDAHQHIAGGTFGVCDINQNARHVTGCQETWGCRTDDNRIADQNVAFRITHRICGPRRRHQVRAEGGRVHDEVDAVVGEDPSQVPPFVRFCVNNSEGNFAVLNVSLIFESL